MEPTWPGRFRHKIVNSYADGNLAREWVEVGRVDWVRVVRWAVRVDGQWAIMDLFLAASHRKRRCPLAALGEGINAMPAT